MATTNVETLIDETLANLRELYAKLNAIPTADMDVGEQRAWFTQYTTLRHAIITLETANMRELNAQEAQEAAAVAKAIDGCETALHGIQETEQIIKGVAKVLGSITSLVTLFA